LLLSYVLAVVLLFIRGIIFTNHIHNQLGIALILSMVTGVISGSAGSAIWTWIKKK